MNKKFFSLRVLALDHTFQTKKKVYFSIMFVCGDIKVYIFPVKKMRYTSGAPCILALIEVCAWKYEHFTFFGVSPIGPDKLPLRRILKMLYKALV